MFKFFKDWYNTHLTEPNQASFALIILFTILILYVLVETVAPILVAIILAYMLEGLVQRSLEYTEIERKFAVILVYSFFITIFVIKNKNIPKIQLIINKPQNTNSKLEFK